jgi:hypothetical protein
MNANRHAKIVREGEYLAEVRVELIQADAGWSPYLSLADARRLDEVREALRRRDVKTASKLGTIYLLSPVAV